MSPRTATLPATDGAMWRKLLARTHPDAGGEHELFIWTRELQDHVLALGPGEAPERGSTYAREDSYPRGDRLDFPPYVDHDRLTARAVELADEVVEPYAGLLRLLQGCVSLPAYGAQEQRGATFKQLAFIAHRVGMGKRERAGWYEVAASVPLSQRHAGHLIERLEDVAA